MQPMRAVHQRVFVERDGQLCYLDSIILEELGQKGNLTLTGHPPKDLDLTSPQTLCLVFQKIADPRTFFDMQYPGMIMVLEGFRAIRGAPVAPIVLLKNIATGEVTIPNPDIEYTYDMIQKWVVDSDGVHITTMRRLIQ